MSKNTPDGSAKRSKPQRLLVINFGDRVAGFSDEPLRTRLVIAPWITDGRADAEIERFVELSLSPFWRDLFWPGLKRFEVVTEKLTPSEIRHRRFERQLLRSIGQAGRIVRGEGVRHG